MKCAVIDQVYSSFGEDGEGYLETLKKDNLYFNLDISLPFSDKLTCILDRIIKSLSKFALYRRGLVKKLFKEINKNGYLLNTKINFPLNSEDNACMYDNGQVYFSLKWIYGESGDNLVKTILHEIAHLILLEYEDYSKLKEINKKFHSIYGKDDRIYVLSPIEYLATRICINLLYANMINCTNDKLKLKYQKQIDKELGKISSSIEFFINNIFIK